MNDEALTFRVGGELTIDKWAEATTRFSQVLKSLEERHNARVSWRLAGLKYGSAAAMAVPVPLDAETEQVIPRIRNDYIECARRVERGEVDPEDHHLRLIQNLTEVADKSNPITFEAIGSRVVFVAPAKVSSTHEREKTTKSLGTVRGRVETLFHRRDLRFSLYDLVTGRAVECHFDSEIKGQMRRAWGHVADVSGTITRDAMTGRPLRIRNITGVEVVEEGDPLGYLQARGALQGAEPAEVAIRRLRNAH